MWSMGGGSVANDATNPNRYYRRIVAGDSLIRLGGFHGPL